MGVPIIAGRLDAAGNPDGRDARWKGWERTRPNHRPVDRWRPGEALAAVTGGKFDVLDVDPRSGGMESLQRLSDMLGDNAPDEYWRVRTSSGGRHLWIARLGIGRKIHFMPGLDLLGLPSLAFLPPTIRPSKDEKNLGELVRYRALTELTVPPARDGSGKTLRGIIEELPANGVGRNGSAGTGHPGTLEELREACLAAGRAGSERHKALLAFTLAYQGQATDDATVLAVAALIREMKCPLRGRSAEADARALLKMGRDRPIMEAIGEEAAVIENGSGPKTSGTMRSFASVGRRKTDWLWKGYLARRETTVLDGEKGCGKSFVVEDIEARLSTGRPMPGEEVGTGEIVHSAHFTVESDEEGEVGLRLDAAGANVSRVHSNVAERDRKTGKAKFLEFPGSGPKFGSRIREVDAGLAVWDPINDFLEEEVNPNSDAGIRHALSPIAPVLRENNCAALMIRHMNKDTSAKASMRGTGTTAYQNRARVHLVCAKLPKGAHPVARYGLAVVDCNLSRARPGVLAYDIVDSDISQDDDGGMVGCVKWYGRIMDMTADELVRGEKKPKHGPEPYALDDLVDVLDELFNDPDTWIRVPEIMAEIRDAGLNKPDSRLKKNAMEMLKLRTVRKEDGWWWTNAKIRPRRNG